MIVRKTPENNKGESDMMSSCDKIRCRPRFFEYHFCLASTTFFEEIRHEYVVQTRKFFSKHLHSVQHTQKKFENLGKKHGQKEALGSGLHKDPQCVVVRNKELFVYATNQSCLNHLLNASQPHYGISNSEFTMV